MRHDLTNDQLVASLNAELERMGYSYRAETPVSRATQTDTLVIQALDRAVDALQRPVKASDIFTYAEDAHRTTIDSALRRMARSGVLVGTTATGYLRRTVA